MKFSPFTFHYKTGEYNVEIDKWIDSIINIRQQHIQNTSGNFVLRAFNKKSAFATLRHKDFNYSQQYQAAIQENVKDLDNQDLKNIILFLKNHLLFIAGRYQFLLIIAALITLIVPVLIFLVSDNNSLISPTLLTIGGIFTFLALAERMYLNNYSGMYQELVNILEDNLKVRDAVRTSQSGTK